MAWTETDSLSFTARHDDSDLGCAQRILDRLEDMRLRLEERFDEAPGDITVVIHDNPAWLSAAHPLLPAVRWAAAPAGRRYLAGWPMIGEIHVLNDYWTERRAAGEDSLTALRGTAERMYCQLVLAANNESLPPMWTPKHFLAYLQWAWLIEGAAQYFTGQTSLFRAAVITRLREGERPPFPPSRRDAVILGGTVFDLLDRTSGPGACEILVSRLHREGPRGNLELAFEASMREIEKAWRMHLDEILYPQAEDLEGASLSEALRQTTSERTAEHQPFDLELGEPPDFSFDPARPNGGRRSSSSGELIEEPDEDEGRDDRGTEPRRESRRRADPRQ
jgi:hypothetical protein